MSNDGAAERTFRDRAATVQKGIADLLALLGYYTSVAMAMTMYDLPPPDINAAAPGPRPDGKKS